jgi:hypothetical protein
MKDKAQREREFLEAIANRLTQVAPKWISVRRDGEEIVVLAHDTPQVFVAGRAGRIGGEPLERGVVEVWTAYNVMDTLQDVVISTTKELWPTSIREGFGLPLPQAQVDDDVLQMWYGDRDNRLLEVEPVRIADLYLED